MKSELNESVAGLHKQAEKALEKSDVKEFNTVKEIATQIAQSYGETESYGFTLASIDLSGKDLSGIDLENCHISGAMCKGTNFQNANLRGLVAQNTNFDGAKFDGADVSYGDFTGAYKADLRNAFDDNFDEPKKSKTKSKSEKMSGGTHVQKDEDLTVSMVQNFFANYLANLKKWKKPLYDADPKKEPRYTKVDPSKPDWIDLKNETGIDVTKLHHKQLSNLLDGRKTDLLPVSKVINGETVNTFAKISVGWDAEKEEYNKLNLNYRKEDLKLDNYYGYVFTKEDKETLLETGHLGKTVDIDFKNGKGKQRRFISVDFDTNEVLSASADAVNLKETFLGVELDRKTRDALENGERVFLKDMTFGNNQINAYVQYSAVTKQFDFDMDEKSKKAVSLDRVTKEMTRYNKKGEEGYFYRGKEFTKDQVVRLSMGESLLVEDFKTVHGHIYSGYLSFNEKKGELSVTSAVKLEKTITSEKTVQKDIKKDIKQDVATSETTETLQPERRSKGLRM